MVAQLKIQFIDYSNETSDAQVNFPNITPANLAAAETAVANYVTAVTPLTLGNIGRRVFPVVIPSANIAPTDENAQREVKWLVGYKDTTQFLDAGNTIANPGFGKNYTHTIPTANPVGQLQTNSDFANLDTDEWQAWIAVFHASFKSPTGGTPAVTYAKFVGRDN